jgi:hypothetical protein
MLSRRSLERMSLDLEQVLVITIVLLMQHRGRSPTAEQTMILDVDVVCVITVGTVGIIRQEPAGASVVVVVSVVVVRRGRRGPARGPNVTTSTFFAERTVWGVLRVVVVNSVLPDRRRSSSTSSRSSACSVHGRSPLGMFHSKRVDGARLAATGTIPTEPAVAVMVITNHEPARSVKCRHGGFE